MQDCWYKDVCKNDCNGSCIRYLEMRKLMEFSNIPNSKQSPAKLVPDNCDFDAFVELAGIKDNIQDFVKSGKNLYLYSEYTGNGKTSWAIKLMLKYFDSIWAGNGFKCRGIFIHVPTFLLQMKDFNNPDRDVVSTMNGIQLADLDLIVWDDIASTGMSAYDTSQLLMNIDARILNEKSNIFTANVGKRDLEKILGTRLASRIWNTSKQIELRGKDKR